MIDDHLISVNEILSRYNILCDKKNNYVGMSDERAQKIIKSNPNVIPERHDKPVLVQFLYNLVEPVNITLILASIGMIIIYCLDKEEKMHFRVSIFTIAIMSLNIVADIVNDCRLQRFYKSNIRSYKCKVLRMQKVETIWKEQIALGDILILRKGDMCAADVRVIKSHDLEVEASTITGSHHLIKKSIFTSKTKFEEADNVILNGSMIVSGYAHAIVVKVGVDTVLGKISSKAMMYKVMHNRLQSELLVVFTFFIAVAALISISFTTIGAIFGIRFLKLLGMVINIFVAFIAEGIPATVKLLLFSFARKLQSRGIFIRDAHAVEVLGSITKLCINKNNLVIPESMQCTSIFNGKDEFDIEMAFIDKNMHTLDFIRKVGSICASCSFEQTKKVDKRMIKAISGLGDVTRNFFDLSNEPELKTRNYNFDAISCSIVTKGSSNTLYFIGNAYDVLNSCKKILSDDKSIKLSKEDKNSLIEISREKESQGFKVIALASRWYPKGATNYKPKNLTLVCLFYLENMPLITSQLAFDLLSTAGISYVIVDSKSSPYTSKLVNEIARGKECSLVEPIRSRDDPSNSPYLELNTEPNYTLERQNNSANQTDDLVLVSSANEYDRLPEPLKVRFLMAKNSLFVAASNLQRHNFVKDLKELKHTVAYLGKTVDDCQAMNMSEVGLSFDNTSQVCMEASEIILPNPFLETLIYGIEEGRLFRINLKKAIRYILANVMPQIIPFVFYIFFKTPIPISAIMLIFFDYMVEIFPSIFFVYEKPEINLMADSPVQTQFKSTLDNLDANQSRFKKYLKRLQRAMSLGGIYSYDMMIWAFFEAGIITSLGCMASFYISLIESDIPVRYFFFSAEKYFLYDSPPIISDEGKILDVHEQEEIIFRCQSTYFVGLLICQFCNMLVCRKTHQYFFSNLHENPKIILASIFGTVLGIGSVSIKYFEDFLLIRKPSLVGLSAPILAGIMILGFDTLKKYKRRNMPSARDKQ